MGDENSKATDGPPRFVFECQMCGESCKRAHIPVTMEDALGWARDGTMERVLAFLKVAPLEGAMILELTKGEDGYCALFHAESGKCSIHYNKPRDCRAFPLGFDGDRFYVRFRDCPGLGKGELAGETLAEMRESARSSFEGGMGMEALLPVLQAVFYRKVMEDSLKAMGSLSDKDRETLEGIMGKSRKEGEGGGGGGGGDGGDGGDGEDVEEVEIRLDDDEEKDEPATPGESPGPADGNDEGPDDGADGDPGDENGDGRDDAGGDDQGDGNGDGRDGG